MIYPGIEDKYYGIGIFCYFFLVSALYESLILSLGRMIERLRWVASGIS